MPRNPGTAVLELLVQRHQELLQECGEEVSAEEALGRLIACLLGRNRQRILETAAAALAAGEYADESAIVHALIANPQIEGSSEKNGTPTSA